MLIILIVYCETMVEKFNAGKISFEEAVNYIDSLLSNKEKLDKLSTNAYESSHNYSSTTFASNALSVYKMAIKNKKNKINFLKKLILKIRRKDNVNNR